MAIQTRCPSCEASYTLAESQRGKKVRCRKCSNTFVVAEDNADEPAASGARSGKLPKDALQTSPRPPSRTPPPPPRAAPVGPRRDKFRDRDDDDRDDGPPRKPDFKKKSGSAMPLILMIGGGILLLFLLCGGGLVVCAFFWAKNTTTDALDSFAPPGDPNNAFDPNGIQFPGGIQLPDANNPKDVGEALAWLKNGETAEKKNKAADWLGKAAVDDGRQKEVAAELEKLIGNPNTRDAAIRGLANWTGPDDCATLCKEMDTNGNLWQFDAAGGPAADALIRLQYKPAAAVFAKRLPDFFAHGSAEKRLSQMGALAEDDVLKYMDNPNGDAHAAADRLLRLYNTTPEAKFNQAVRDLKDPDAGYERMACDFLAKVPVVEARHAEVARALETPLGDKDGETRKAAVRALKTWGTKDNIASIIAELNNPSDPFHGSFGDCVQALASFQDEKAADAIAAHLPDWGGNRDAAVTALRQMGPAAEKAVARYATHPDADVSGKANALLKAFKTKPDVILAATIDDLDPLQTKDANQRRAACDYLAKQPMDEAHQKDVARGLDALLDDADPFAGVRQAAAKAEIVWADKESVPALIKAMSKENSDIWEPCMEALARVKDERGVIAVLTQYPKHKNEAIKALQEMGPAVESAMITVLTDPSATPGDRVVACSVLQEVGTAKSIPALTAASADANVLVKRAAGLALTAVRKRS